MATKQERLIEANRRGLLKGEMKAKFDEAVKRGLIVLPKAEAAPKQQPEKQESTILDTAKRAIDETIGAFEPALTFATGAIAEPIAGLAGLAAAPFTADTGASVVEQTRDILTFDPITKRGQRTLSAAGRAIEPVTELAQQAFEPVTEATLNVAGPEAATFVHTLPVAALEAIGLKGLKSARGKKQITGITDDVAEKLQQEGVSLDDVSDTEIQKIQAEVSKAAQERLQRFQQQGIPATQGDITQQSAQKAAEARILEVPTAEGRADLVSTRVKQSQGLENNLETLRDSLSGGINVQDIGREAGESAKLALGDVKKGLFSKKQQLYTQFAEDSKTLSDIPLDVEQIKGVIPDDETLNRLARGEGGDAINEVDDLLVEFGIIDEPNLVNKYLQGTDRKGRPNEINPLNVANHDEFRQALNAIDSPRAAPYVGPIKQSLDGEIDLIGDALEDAGIDTSRLGAIKEARSTVRELKTKFSPKSVAGRMINAKADGVTPQIEASKVFDQIATANKPIEDLERVMSIFNEAGKKGERAKKVFQAKVVSDLIDGAFSAKSRTIDGNQLISRAGFDRALNKIGDDKIKVIFADNPEGLNAINQISQTVDDITPSGFEVPKGSASVILSVIDKAVGLTQIGNLNFVRGSLGTVKDIVERGESSRVIQDALSPDPEKNKVAIKRLDSVKAQMPNLYKTLGIAQLVPETQTEEK